MFYNPSAASWVYEGPTQTSAVESFHRSLPEYAITPLIAIPSLAEELGLGHVLLKDESNRLGLPAFKILGAAWATFKAVARECQSPLTVTLERLGAEASKKGLRVVTCTEGNWGRAVARMAQYLHIEAVILVPNNMDRATQKKIESEGATVIVVDGDYDFSIMQARKEVDAGGLLIMDSSWDGYKEVPQVSPPCLRVIVADM